MKAWEAIKKVNGQEIDVDTVFFNTDCDAQYVFDALVNHDGMDIDYVRNETGRKNGLITYAVWPEQD